MTVRPAACLPALHACRLRDLGGRPATQTTCDCETQSMCSLPASGFLVPFFLAFLAGLNRCTASVQASAAPQAAAPPAGGEQKKLWGGRFTGKTDPLMEKFNESLPFDKRMWSEDIRVCALIRHSPAAIALPCPALPCPALPCPPRPALPWPGCLPCLLPRLPA